ncbi:MAG: hypothetical protein PWR10_2212 [Halanaerobiales bacterium]|nr:hypothetical protein [Halanaerobiales bacterium]
MKNYKVILPVLGLLIILLSNLALAITAEEIINRRDDNEYIVSARVESEMVIINGGRKMVKTMISLTDGRDGLTEFTNPRDRGTKFLKRGDDLWMFFPDAEDVVKISGHMLNQGMMGSDFSYQDIMESDKLTDLYNFEVIGEEEFAGRPCYLLEGIAKEGAEVSYYRRKIWIDKERFIGLKMELYAQSGRLLKVSRAEKVEKIEGRWLPTESVMENKLRRNTRTEFKIISIEFNPEIPGGTFTLQNLQ